MELVFSWSLLTHPDKPVSHADKVLNGVLWYCVSILKFVSNTHQSPCGELFVRWDAVYLLSSPIHS